MSYHALGQLAGRPPAPPGALAQDVVQDPLSGAWIYRAEVAEGYLGELCDVPVTDRQVTPIGPPGAVSDDDVEFVSPPVSQPAEDALVWIARKHAAGKTVMLGSNTGPALSQKPSAGGKIWLKAVSTPEQAVAASGMYAVLWRSTQPLPAWVPSCNGGATTKAPAEVRPEVIKAGYYTGYAVGTLAMLGAVGLLIYVAARK